MKKEKKVSKKIQRQLDILSKYYDIDQENRLIKIKLCYEKAEDLFEMDVVTKGTPKFKTEILARISELLESVPEDYKVDFAIKVDDYQGVVVDNIVESFKDQLEVFNFQIYRVKSGRWLTAVILMLVSVGILFVRRFLLNNNFIDDSVLLTEMLDITAWVFLWEGVSTVFLRSDEYRDISFKIVNALNSFSLYDKDNKVVSSYNRDAIVKDWVQVSRKERTARKMLLIAGALSFAIGVVTVIGIIPEFFKAQEDWGTFILGSVTKIVAGVIGIIGGIGAASVYCESGKFRRAVPVVSYIYLIYDIGFMGLVIYLLATAGLTSQEKTVLVVDAILMVAASVVYFISYMMLRSAGKANGEEDIYKL